MKVLEYRGQIIKQVRPNLWDVYLYNADGDIDLACFGEEYDAKSFVDKWIEKHKGYYDCEGNLVGE